MADLHLRRRPRLLFVGHPATTCGGQPLHPIHQHFLASVPLLIHRDWRDDRHCAEKYGNDWVTYRKKLRRHIVPGVY